MPTPIRKRPEPFTRDNILLVISDADEFRVRGAALHADPVQVRRCVGARNGVGDLVGPDETLAGAVVGVEGCAPGALEVCVFGLPDAVGGVDGVVGLGGVGAVV
tara:strand:+ start:5032 stop:5343 length:312 start_codon:yes stop_codon:yes gene_type:complete